jgi:hypothetical protein
MGMLSTLVCVVVEALLTCALIIVACVVIGSMSKKGGKQCKK